MSKEPNRLCEICLTNPVSRKRWVNTTCLSCDEDIGQCCLCYKKIGISFSRTTCFGLRVCRKCSQEQIHMLGRFPKSTVELKNERMYEEFLQKRAYPEVKVWHKAIDGVETTDPIRDGKFFRVGIRN